MDVVKGTPAGLTTACKNKEKDRKNEPTHGLPAVDRAFVIDARRLPDVELAPFEIHRLIGYGGRHS